MINVSKTYSYCFIFFIGMTSIPILKAQDFQQVCKVKVSNIDKSVVDDFGNVFITNTQGDIQKINAKCEKTLVYSPTKTGIIKQIDIWSQFKIFALFEEFQEFILLDRFLTTPVKYEFSTFNLGYISNATLNYQREIWVVDESDFSLKLLNYESKNIITSQQLNQYLDPTNHSIIGIKEFRGKLFIFDAITGVLIFDNLGNFISKINAKGINSFNFYGNNLNYFKDQKLFQVSLKDLSQQQLVKPNAQFDALMKNKDSFYGLTKDRLTIYK